MSSKVRRGTDSFERRHRSDCDADASSSPPGRTLEGMKGLLLFIAFLAFMKWRHERFESSDARNGFGAYAPVKPESPRPTLRNPLTG
jgi:hypothetical protein